jgi:hypothetical protein
MLVEELNVTALAGKSPKKTALSLEKLAPVIVTEVKPPVGPEVVPRLVTVGVLEVDVYVKAEPDDVPSTFVTVTFAVPDAWIGTTALIVLFERMLNWVAAALPNLTARAVEKFAPVIVTILPPAVVSVEIDRLVIAGGAD